jgi:hypothetical protein
MDFGKRQGTSCCRCGLEYRFSSLVKTTLSYLFMNIPLVRPSPIKLKNIDPAPVKYQQSAPVDLVFCMDEELEECNYYEEVDVQLEDAILELREITRVN